MTSMAWSVSMFVYIELASAVKRRALGGRGPSSSSRSSRLVLSLMYVGTNGLSFWSQKSSHLLNAFMKVPTQHTMGRILYGFLCAFRLILKRATLSPYRWQASLW